MDTSLREILTVVREGRLDPAEAARRLDEVPPGADPVPTEVPVVAADVATPPTAEDTSRPTSPAATWSAVTDDVGGRSAAPPPQRAPTPPAAPHALAPPPALASVDDRETTQLQVRSMMRRVRIVGDPSVATVSIDGGHELRREGTVLVCESNRQLPFGDQFEFSPLGLDRFRLHLAGKKLSLTDDISIRVNPAIDVDVEITAGPVTVDHVGRLRARVTAGSLRVDDVTGPIDLHVVGGSAKIDTRLGVGTHRVRCESGSIVMTLRDGSDVRVRADAQFGRIVVNGASGPGATAAETVVGTGAGRLDVEVVMGSVTMDLPQ